MNQEQMRAVDAQQLLDNPVFKGAVEHMEAYLETQALNVNPADKDLCTKVIISKQMLRGVVREIHRYIETGQVAAMQELKKTPLKDRVFQR